MKAKQTKPNLVRSWTTLIICISIFLSLLAGKNVTAQTYESVLWNTASAQPFAVSEAQGKVVNGKLYTFGGFDVLKSPTFTPTKRAYLYDIVTDTWTAIRDLPFTPNGSNFGGVTHAGITTDGTDIFLAGGYTSNATGNGQIFGTNQAWKYNIASDTYTALPNLPYATSAGQMEFLGNKLHLIGGTNPARTDDLGDHLVLDLNNLAAGWTTLAPLPNPRHHGGSAVVNGKIYFIGGQHDHDGQLTTQNDVHVYDPGTNTWTQVADIPSPAGTPGRSHITSSTVVVDNKILVLAGETSHGVSTNLVSLYNPLSDTWETLTPLPANRFSGVGAYLGKRFIYTGGSTTSTTYLGVAIKPASFKVNFQDNATATPTGWLKDFGQSYGPRTSPSQGTGNTYGWLAKSDNSPLDLTLNGRNRNTPSNVIFATLMHMQANHLATFSGTKTEGIWQAQVANGTYEVAVSVGDGSQTDSRHFINIEGVNAVNDFVPTTNTRFRSGFATVTVNDNTLTVDATGGNNSKINYVVAYPVSTVSLETLSFTPATLNFNVFQFGSAPGQSSTLNASTGTPSITLAKSGSSAWLILPSNPTVGSLTFNVDATGLAPGNYSSTVTASASGYTNATLQVSLQVSSDPNLTTFSLQPVADAYTRFSTPTSNFGTADTLVAKTTSSNTFNRNSYLKFSLSGVQSVASAKLRIYGGNIESTAAIPTSVFGISNDTWTESAINWNNAPAASTSALAAIGITNTRQYYEFDVTSFVNTQLSGDGIVSLLVSDATSTSGKMLVFNSKENATNKPELLIQGTQTNNSLSFTPDSIHFTVTENGSTANKQSTLAASSGTPSVTLSKSANSNWLILPSSPSLGALSFGINSAGLAPGTYSAIVTASASGYSDGQLEVVLQVDPEIKTLSFTPDSIHFTVTENGTVASQQSTMAASTGSPSISLTKSANSNWLVLPSSPALGALDFGINSAGLAPGTYSAIVTASATGYTDGQLEVVLQVNADVKTLSFTPDSIHFTVIENGSVASQQSTLAASTGSPSISLTKSANSDWLVLPSSPAPGALDFGINSAGLAPGIYSAIVTASATGYTDGQLEVVLQVNTDVKTLSFTPDSIHFTVLQNGSVGNQQSTLAASNGTPSISLTKSANSDWLVLPSSPALGALDFGINSAGLAPGIYSAIVTASATGYTDGQLEVVLQVDAPPPPQTLSFTETSLSFQIVQGQSANAQNATLSASTGSPSVTLAKSANSDWLILPSANSVGTLAFNINGTGLQPGSYISTVTATATNYTSATLQINLTVIKAGSDSLVLSPIADAYTRFSTPSTNYGSADTIVAKTTSSNTFNRNSYLKFSLANVQGVTTAKLRLYGKNIESNAAMSASLFGLNNDTWTESGITWNNAPTSTAAPLSVVGVNNVAKYYEFDVTSFVISELSGDKVVSFLLSDVTSTSGKLISFNSKENALNKPELLIVDETAGKTLSFTPDTINFTVVQNGSTFNSTSTLSASVGSPSVSLAKSVNSSWLILPSNPTLGSLSFGVNATGLAPGLYTSTITASASGYADGKLVARLQVNMDPGSPSIVFTPKPRNVDVEQGTSIDLLEYLATSDSSVVSVQLTAADADGNVPSWLFLNSGLINGVSFTTGSEMTLIADATNLSIGTHVASVTATRNGYNSGVLDITLNVKAGSSGTLADIKVNFQDAATVPPTGWVRDFGQSFGVRTSPNQGSGNVYGWIRRDNGAPLDLTLNGRKRNTPSDILLATFMHMQGNQIANFNGTRVEGVWEMHVGNGAYDVTVSVGDGTAIDSRHYINVEGVPAIIDFVPTSSTLFKSATVSVSVSDGLLTIDAIGGSNTKINYVIIKPTTTQRPSVVSVSPENASTNVSENTSISTLILNLPNGGINNATITDASVYLTEEGDDSTHIAANVNGTGGGDAITLVPSSALKLSTTYNFHITSGVKDLSGASFIPYSSSFRTGAVSTSEISNAKFDRIDLPNGGGRHSSLTIGPDGKLYALSIDGIIKRFTINQDGTLQDPELLYSLQDAQGTRTPRLAIGFAFDPASTPTNLIAYITHSTYVFLDGPTWDGRLSRLSGANLENVQDLIIHLPRSAKDHLTNGIAFGPDGKLYFTQGSNSAMGSADLTWGNRDESLLSGAVLKLDLQKLGTLPLDARTMNDGGSYNPYAANAPLTIYASGVRNAYDLLWHTNGELYVPTNGSAAGGNTPASITGAPRTDGSTYNGPAVPGLSNVRQTQKDFLFRVQQGGYYGHPNPKRGEFVMNGGNPTSGIDPAQVDQYPTGTLPDANYRGFAFDFQMNKSPNGVIEYKSMSFNGALKGKIMVVRYSQHDDIITLTPGGATKDIISYNEGSSIQGFTGFIDPLDLTEDVRNGNIYVSEYGGDGMITLLRPQVPPSAPIGKIELDIDTVYYNQVIDAGASAATEITIRNVGAGNLVISSINKSGSNPAEFILTNTPSFPATIAPNNVLKFNIAFDPTVVGIRTASIGISSNDTTMSVASVLVRGLGTAGLGGTNEPSLQAILNLYQLPINSGDDDANTNVIHSNTTSQKAAILGDEVSIQQFVKAGSGNVTIEPLAVFGPTTTDTIVRLGWYLSGTASSLNEILLVRNNPLSNGQTVKVNYIGTTSFDPGSSNFGFYSRWPFFSDRHLYSEDALNTFASAIPHHVRVYPYKLPSGQLVPNTYLVAFEEHISGFDYQDVVFIVRNVKNGNQLNVVQAPIADAFTRNGSFAAQNFGTDTTLTIKAVSSGTGFGRSTYLKFSVANVSDVISAKLRVYGHNRDNAIATSLSVFGVTNDSWNEYNVTFNNAPAASGAALGTISVNDQLKYYELDVSDFVKTQFNGDKIASFLVSDPLNQNRQIDFNSRENRSNVPELVLTTSSKLPVSQALMQIENLDKFPSGEVFLGSRMHFPWTRDSVEPKVFNKDHDTIEIRIHNRGATNLVISNLIRSNPRNWLFLKLKGVAYDSTTSLPLVIAPGTSADLTMQFVEPTDLNVRIQQYFNHLTIISNDEKFPAKIIYLNGQWQRAGEGSREPRAQEMISSFGFKSQTGFGGNDPDQGNPSKPKGDEIISTYFVRADASKPVYVIQMAAYHGCCTQLETFRWYAKTTGTPVLNGLFTHIGVDGQSMLPRKGNNGAPADGSFVPTGPFGLKVGNSDHSDTLRNPGRKIGIRVWKAKDAKGNVIPNEYIVANDYLGTQFTNYDYNDNLYYIKNIRPELSNVNYSTLGATPSALDFNEQVVGSQVQLPVTIKNNGVASYPNGSSDPQIVISSVQIVGENSGEFSVSLPGSMTLNAQQTTSLNVTFSPASQGLKIADLLINYNFGASPLRIPLYAIAKNTGVTVNVHNRIKSGSTSPMVVNGKTWSAETGFAFDNLEPFSNTAVSSIQCSDDDSLYLREQSSNGDKRPFRYEIPLANGSYIVRLHFAEIYWGAPGSGVNGGPGSRVMSVTMENQVKIPSLDVAAEVGTATALIKNIPISVSDGKLNISFTASVNRPMVCAVEVYSFSSGAPASLDTTAAVVSMTEVIGANQLEKPAIFPNPLKNKFHIRFPTTYHGKLNLTLADLRGRTFNLGKHFLNYGGSNLEVDISRLALRPGIYFLQMNYEKHATEVVKLIVQ